MKSLLLILGLTIFLSTSTLAQHLGKSPEGLEMFKIDLNLEPEDRFVEPTLYFKEPALELFKLYKDVISNAIAYMFKALDMVTWSRYNER